MTEELAKEAFKEAENSLKEKQKQVVKDIVLKTLEKLDRIKKEIKEKQEEERILKLDLEDLKAGKIDRIVERQEKDPKAKEVSVVVIVKEKEVVHEHHHHYDYWHWPYTVVWQVPYVPVWPSGTIVCKTGASGTPNFGATTSDDIFTGSGTLLDGYSINCSVAKDEAIGTYNVNGHIVHLR